MAQYRLLFLQPEGKAWQQVPITMQSFNIGREAGNNLELNDTQASRQHARLYFDERGAWIIDQNSSNGVFIAGKRIQAQQWVSLPVNTDFTIGDTTLRLEALQSTVHGAQPGIPNRPPQPPPAVRAAPRKNSLTLPLIGLLVVAACVLLIGAGAAAWYLIPRFLSKQPTTVAGPNLTPTGQSTATSTAEPTAAPPIVIDSLPANPGAGMITDDRGVSLTVPAQALENGQQAYLERANLSPGMQHEIEQGYLVESLVYAVRLQDGQDGIGRVELVLPAKSSDSRLAVLIDDRWLGVLETPTQDGAFKITPNTALSSSGQSYFEPTSGATQSPNRYLVLTPKSGASQAPQGGLKLVSLAAQADSDGKSCIAEFWTANHCWRNPESSVYVFWENDWPASLKDQEYLRIIDTIKAVAALMSSYQQKGFTAAAISPSNPAYIIIEADASEPYYSFKTGNVYIPWDIVGGINDSQNRCTMAHEFFHWIEDEEYRMGAAALSGPKSWWLETSAENGAFLLDSSCIERNLTQYGLVNTSSNVLGFQANPFQWEFGEQARYIHALQLYLSICDGGGNCVISEQAWAQAINSGTYPLEGSAASAYENNAKDLGRFLLGAAPLESRAGAVIPPSAINGSRYGDYLSLRTSAKGIWDFGLTMNQFSKTSDQQIKVEAKIAKGGVYPLWISNGTATPMGGGGGLTGLPGLLEIEAGPAFWLKQDQADPVFYPAGKGLKLGPISNKLGIGSARMVAISPEGQNTFRASLSLADLSGDWSATINDIQVTPVDCKGYESSDEQQKSSEDTFLQMFSGNGTYVKKGTDPTDLNLNWEGTFPEGATGTSEVTVSADKIILHYLIDIPKPVDSGESLWLPWKMAISNTKPYSMNRRNGLLAAWPAVPVLGALAWLQRRRRKWSQFLLAGLILLGALILASCFGFAMWGTIETTYTFDKLEYVDPQQVSESGEASSEAQPALKWKLTHGQVDYNLNLMIEVTSDDSDGSSTSEVEPCTLKATGTATGTIGPEGSVAPPDTEN